AGSAAAEEKYNGRLMTRGGPNSEPAIKVQFVIDDYSTGEEVWKLQQLLELSGYEPFIQAFRGTNKGKVIIFGSRGLKVNIHVAQVVPKENGRKIFLFTEKQSWDLEVVQRMDDRYPYLVIELDLDNRGKGSGKIYENAQIRMSGDASSGTSAMELESYNSTPKSVFGVSLVK
ncbi:MAG: hypothetical protein JW742_08070, partial [Candidatus Aminicenantes bacterium]|nr:hypothetical protein [Candidatus Aminicenantes bacterium]